METLTAGNGKNAAPKKHEIDRQLFGRLAGEEGIPVYELTFDTSRPAGPDLPLASASTGGVRCLRVGSHNVRSIDFVPKLRAYRVMLSLGNPKLGVDGVKMFFIPETWGTWEPLVGQQLAT